MKKILMSFLIIMMLAGCSEQMANNDLKLISPKGAPTIGVIGYLKDNASNVVTVDGSDALIAAFTQVDSEYDVIAAPINLGCGLIKKKATDYRLLGVITWGNLYLVNNTSLKDNNCACFGQSAVPGKIINLVLDERYEYQWLNSVSDVAPMMIANKYKYGILAEPVLSKVLEKNKDISIEKNLQDEYEKITGVSDYPQAGIFVKEDEYKANKKVYDDFCTKISSYDYVTENFKADLDLIGEQVIGVSSSIIGEETIKRMNIGFQFANDVENEIATFLKLLEIDDISGMIIK